MPNEIQLAPLRKATGESFVGVIIVDPDIPPGVTVSSVAIVSSTGLTVSGAGPTTETYSHTNGLTYAIGRAFKYTVSGGTTGSTHYAVFAVTHSDGSVRYWSQPWVILDPEAA